MSFFSGFSLIVDASPYYQKHFLEYPLSPYQNHIPRSHNKGGNLSQADTYNLRNITFAQNAAISDNLLYTGCTLGKNINYTDVRNEGDISFNVNNEITGNVQIYGVFEEVSANHTAKTIFNGGDINFVVKANITGNIYISGICYSNKNHTNSSFYTNGNPLETTFDKDYRGTLDNVINDGDLSYTLYDVVKTNNRTISADASNYTINGNVLVSGITALNESSITNTFNLGDILTVNAFKNDLDIHTRTAMDIFNVKKEEVTSLMRRQAKAVNFGILYGISSFGLSEDLGISVKEAKEFMNKYYETYSGIKKYMQEVVKDAYEKGYVKTIMNRKRRIDELKNTNYMIRQQGERMALNTPIQGSSADIMMQSR